MLHHGSLIEVEVDGRTPVTKMCEPNPYYRANSTLLARLAEAVDGNRKGAPVVYVAEYWYRPSGKGHEVHGPFENCQEAIQFRADILGDPDGKQYGVFGPYWTKLAQSGTVARRAGTVVKQVVVHLSDGQTISLDPTDVDAVFWSPAAIDKFVLPYYAGIGSVEEAAEIVKKLERGIILVHRPGSEWRTEPGIKMNGSPIPEDPGIGTVLVEVKPAADPTGPKIVASPLI